MYQKKSGSWLKHSDFIILDILSLQLSMILAYVFRHGFANPYANSLYGRMALFLLLADFSTVFFWESFKNVLKRNKYTEFVATLRQVFIVILLSVLYLFSTKESGYYSRIVLYLTGFLYLLISYSARLLWKKIVLKRMRGKGNRSLLVITYEGNAEDVAKSVTEKTLGRYSLCGIAVINRDMTGQRIGAFSVVANRQSASEYVLREWVDEVLISLPAGESCPEGLVEELAETGVAMHLDISHIFTAAGNKQLVEKMGEFTVLTSTMNYASDKQLAVKRLVDICGGLIGCLFTVLVFIVIAPIIYISSPGPIFFTQTRIGKNGKKFKMYKFRSMYMDAEKRKKEFMDQNRIKDGMMFKLDFDTRIIGNKILPDGRRKTGIGEFIRKTSLDEFPQFFNVLKGDMSLVGTRPPTLDEWEKYKLHHRARLAIKPGITGLWQVSGRSNIIDFEEVVRLDTQYIINWSFALDIKILFKTVATVLKKEGSM